MKYTAKAISSKKYLLNSDNINLGSVTYKNLFKTDVTLELGSSFRYKIRSKHLWKPTFSVFLTDQKIIEIKDNSVFEVYFGQNIERFTFKKKSPIKNQYILQNSENKILLTIDYKIVWQKLSYEYEFHTFIPFYKLPQKELLLLTLLFYTNYSITHALAAVS